MQRTGPRTTHVHPPGAEHTAVLPRGADGWLDGCMYCEHTWAGGYNSAAGARSRPHTSSTWWVQQQQAYTLNRVGCSQASQIHKQRSRNSPVRQARVLHMPISSPEYHRIRLQDGFFIREGCGKVGTTQGCRGKARKENLKEITVMTTVWLVFVCVVLVWMRAS